MPVSIVIPIRIRLDPTAHAAEPDGLANAVEAATVRALAGARKAVFEPRGGYARPRLRQPDITFYGEGLGALDAEVRADIDRTLREAIARATMAVDLDVGRLRRESAPEVVEPNATGAFDDAREGLDEASYMVQSYGSDSRRPDEAVIGKKGTRTGRSQKPAPRARMQLVVSELDPQALLAAGGLYLAEVIRKQLAGQYQRATPIGILFRNRATGSEWLAVFSARLDGDTLIAQSDLLFDQHIAGLGLRTDEASYVATSPSSAGTVIQIHEVGGGRIDDEEQLIGMVADFNKKHGTLETLYQALRKRKPVTSRDRELLPLIQDGTPDALYRRHAANMISHVYQGGGCRLFQRGDYADLFLLNPNFPNYRQLTIIPLLEAGVEAAKAAGKGKVGGTGDSSEPIQPPLTGDEETFTYSVGDIEVELIAGAFEGEPAVDSLGALGQRIAEVMAEIAELLRLTGRSWDYGGAFAINAARVMRAQTATAMDRDAGELADIKPAPFGHGNAGDAEVRISTSAAVQHLRDLASCAPLLEQLSLLMQEVYKQPFPQITRHGGEYSASWRVHFLVEFSSAAEWAVYSIFAECCRVCLAQLLAASRHGIAWLDVNFENYFRSIEGLLLGQVARLSQLRRMREHILQAEAGNFAGIVVRTLAGLPLTRKPGTRGLWTDVKEGGAASVRVGFQAWRDAVEWFEQGDKLDTIGRYQREVAARTRVEGEIVQQDDGSFSVAETLDGKRILWSRAELEEAIRASESTASMMSPLVRHMINLEGSVAAFQTREGAHAYMERLVAKMKQANEDAIAANRGDAMFAFRTAKLSDNWQAPGTSAGVTMQNIHFMVHQTIGPQFGDTGFYRAGLKFLFGSEKGRETLAPILELFVTIGAFVLFAPAGFAISGGMALKRHGEAAEHEAVAWGLLEPDAVLSHADAELEMFMSHFEIALLLVPEAGQITRRLIGGYRTVFAKEIRDGVRVAAKQVRAHMIGEFGNALKGELMASFVHQLVTAKALEPILQTALGPAFQELADEAGFGAGKGGATQREGVNADKLQFLAEYGDISIEMEPDERLEDRP